MVSVRQLELNLEVAFEEATEVPEKADVLALWTQFECELAGLEQRDRLRVAGDILLQLAGLCEAKAEVLWEDWQDAHNADGSVMDGNWLQGLTRQTRIADRNFCTRSTLIGIAQRRAYFIIRAHQNLPCEALAPLESIGLSATGEVFDQPVSVTYEGSDLTLRRIVIRLLKPTRHGDTEVAVFTNLPMSVTALTIAELYRKRWSVEGLFQIVTDVFSCELNTLGYPRAALFVFCVALVAFNILSTVKAALKIVHGTGKIEAGLSDFYLVEEVQGIFRGMMITLPVPVWHLFEQMSVDAFADTLKEWAALVNLKRFQSSPRGPKKPVQKDKFDPKHPHVSTARLLHQKKNKRSP